MVADSMVRIIGRVCVPQVSELHKEILSEAHSSAYTLHPGSTKMYCDLRGNFWCHEMKKDIAEFVARDEERGSRVCGTVSVVSASEDRASQRSKPYSAIRDLGVEVG